MTSLHLPSRDHGMCAIADAHFRVGACEGATRTPRQPERVIASCTNPDALCQLAPDQLSTGSVYFFGGGSPIRSISLLGRPARRRQCLLEDNDLARVVQVVLRRAAELSVRRILR